MKRGQQDFRTERYLRYGIRKYSFGAASVAIAAGLMFLGTGAVSATEVEGVNETSSTTTPTLTIGDEGANQGANSSKPTTYDAEPVLTRDASEDTASSQASDENTEAAVTESSTETVADKTELQSKILTLRTAIQSATKGTDSLALDFANQTLTSAQAVLEAKPSQEEVAQQVQALTNAITVIAEASSQAQANQVDTAETNQSSEKVELEKRVSEADVTNRLVNSFLEKEANDSSLSEDVKSAIRAAIASNAAKITEAKAALANGDASAQALNQSMAELKSSIEAVYVTLRKTGKEEFSVSLADTPPAGGVIAQPNAKDYISIPQGDGTYKIVSTAITEASATGKDIYTFGATAATRGDVSTDRISGDITTLEAVVYSHQRTGTDTNPGNSGQGNNNKGRMDFPLTKEQAEALAAEAPLWKGKLRADGSTISTGNNVVFGAGGGYEYLATHIYHYVYEQGTDRVYIEKIKGRFSVTEKAAKAGWEVSKVEPTNLPTGLTYNAATDTIQGKIVTDGLANGVYDTRMYVTYTNKQTNATVRAVYRNLRGGWIGWQDTTPPNIGTNGEVFEGKVGKSSFTNEQGHSTNSIDIHYSDTSGSRAMSGGANVSYTLADGTNVTVRNQYGPSTTGISGNIVTATGTARAVDTEIPGLTYALDGSKPLTSPDGVTTGYTGKALISGTPTEAGIYYVTAYAKDWNQPTGANGWTTQGQETHAGITVKVAPKIDVLNIAAYGTEVPVTISKGATYAKVTMPDGSVTALENREGKWYVAAEGTTNTAVTAGELVGTVGEQFKLKVTSEMTATAGVNKISVYAKTEAVTASLMRSSVTLQDNDNSSHVATLNKTSGRWELPAEYATVRTDHRDGTYDVTNREVYTSVQADGSIKFYIYAYNRSYDATGKVTAVNDVTRKETVYARENTLATRVGNGTYVTVSYDKATNTWSSSDQSVVTARKTDADHWEVSTSSGFSGVVKATTAESTDEATIINRKPTVTSTSYTTKMNTTVDLVDRSLDGVSTVTTNAHVTVADAEDDSLPSTSDAEKTFKTSHNTKITTITVTDPNGGVVASYTKTGDAHNYPDATSLKLTEVGVYTVTVDVMDSNTNLVDETNVGETTAGTDHGANTSTARTVYTITVTPLDIEGQPTKSLAIQGRPQSGNPTFEFKTDTETETEKETEIDQGTKLYSLEGAIDGSVTATKDGKTIGTYKIDKDTGLVTFTPEKDFTGEAPAVTVRLTVTFANDTTGNPLTATATATYTPTVIPVTPSSEASKTTGPQGQAQTSVIKYDTADTDASTVNFTKGSALVETVEKSVDLDKGTVTLLDANGAETTTVTVANQGTYSLNKDTNTITFQPLSSFVGKATPVTVQVKDDNGTATTTTYTPTVTAVTMTSEDATSTGIQGATQSGTPEFETSDPSVTIATRQLLDPSTMQPTTSVTIANEGTYTIEPTTGLVTFVPDPSYKKKGTGVTVQATDSNGETSTATYTPTVTPVSLTSTDVTSKDIQGAEQEGTPTFALSNGAEATTTITGYKLVDPTTGQATDETSVVVQSVGKYTIDSTTGKVTFQPDGAYKGTPDAIKVEATATVKNAKNETASITKEATYTPTVIPVTPSSEASETTGPQGQAQTSVIKYDTADTDASTVNFTKGSAMVETVEKSVELDKGTVTLLDADGAETTTVTVANQGTYSLNKDTNTITFQPLSSFVGKATPVTVQVKDANGTITTTTYTPTVTAVTPTGASSVTEGARGTIQTSPVVFDTPDQDNTTVNFNKGHEKVELDKSTLTLVDKTGKEVKEVVVPGEGTYVLKDGVVEFTPEKDFVGKTSGVTVQVKDVNGKVVSETYTPTVRPVTEFKDTDGNVVSGSTTEDGKVDKKDFPGYRFVETKVDNKGNTTHIYEKVTTTFKDKEGNLITVDKDNNPVKSTEKGEIPAKTIPGYKFVETKKLPNGDIEHIYEKVTTTFKDKEGNLITVDKDNNPVKSTEEGETPAKTIPGYKFVETKKLPNGDIEHIYEKVTTSFKDKDGNEIPNYPSEPGTVDKKDIPEYRFVETEKLPNGDTEHIYEKVSTFFKDKEGKEIPNYPSEPGTVDKKEIPEYRFVETKKLPNGDTEHIYEKVSTFFKDKEGKEIPNYPSEPGTVDKKDIPEYRFVETKKLSNGDTVHVYEKVTPPAPQPNPGKQNTTTWTDENGNPLKPTEPGSKEPGTIPGYEYVKTVTDSNGNIRHIFHKVEMPTPTPVEPTQPVQPVEPATPAIPEQPAKSQMPATPKYVDGQKELPNTGTEANASLAALGLLGVLGGFGLLARKKKED
ncbi:YSIRK-type signal peptide-containing protein [Streptococcus sp. 202]|uniref:YSIRK-type signal peptide-containing protein n=1 Tax=Streptococcus sp. 202 TaxID=2582646 RepID=UPI001563B261|nr:YSIRK-type signal peptide-containing protein [Streptococcus sp. 202]